MIRNIIYIAIGCLFFTDSLAQNKQFMRLAVGDTVPDLIFDKVLNHSKETIALSEFKDQFLILDFWTTYCVSCIQSFPKLNQIQDQYQGEVKILLVSEYGDLQHNQNFFESRKGDKRINLPSIVGDSVLKELFPHRGVPFVVWIDGNRIVRAFTNHIAVTSENVGLMLTDKTLVFPEKRIQSTFDRLKPLFVNDNGGKDDGFIYRSMFAGYIDSIPYSGFVRQQDSANIRLFLMNRTFDEMYRELYSIAYKDSLDSLSWKYLYAKGPIIKLPAEFQYQPRSKVSIDYIENELFNRDNSFTYELMVPREKGLSFAYEKMYNELNLFFGIKVVLTECEVDALELSGQTPNIGSSESPDISTNGEFLIARGVSLKNVVDHINNTLEVPFIVNKSEDKIKVDIKISLSGDLLKNLFESFEQLGYQLKQSKIKVQQMVYESKI